VLAVDVGVADDLGDVAALNVPMRIGVWALLPFDVHLHPWCPIHHPAVAQTVGAQRSLRQLIPTKINVFGARSELIIEYHVVKL
jgi:hypothetical protein